MNDNNEFYKKLPRDIHNHIFSFFISKEEFSIIARVSRYFLQLSKTSFWKNFHQLDVNEQYKVLIRLCVNLDHFTVDQCRFYKDNIERCLKFSKLYVENKAIALTILTILYKKLEINDFLKEQYSKTFNLVTSPLVSTLLQFLVAEVNGEELCCLISIILFSRERRALGDDDLRLFFYVIDRIVGFLSVQQIEIVQPLFEKIKFNTDEIYDKTNLGRNLFAMNRVVENLKRIYSKTNSYPTKTSYMFFASTKIKDIVNAVFPLIAVWDHRESVDYFEIIKKLLSLTAVSNLGSIKNTLCLIVTKLSETQINNLLQDLEKDLSVFLLFLNYSVSFLPKKYLQKSFEIIALSFASDYICTERLTSLLSIVSKILHNMDIYKLDLDKKIVDIIFEKTMWNLLRSGEIAMKGTFVLISLWPYVSSCQIKNFSTYYSYGYHANSDHSDFLVELLEKLYYERLLKQGEHEMLLPVLKIFHDVSAVRDRVLRLEQDLKEKPFELFKKEHVSVPDHIKLSNGAIKERRSSCIDEEIEDESVSDEPLLFQHSFVNQLKEVLENDVFFEKNEDIMETAIILYCLSPTRTIEELYSFKEDMGNIFKQYCDETELNKLYLSIIDDYILKMLGSRSHKRKRESYNFSYPNLPPQGGKELK